MAIEKELLREVISLVLKINPCPADAQIHELACVLGIDKETLEAEMYEMLGESEGTLTDAHEVEINADSQEVLEEVGVDPDTIPSNDLASNDGDPTSEDTGMQQETNDDGPDVHDIGVGLNTDDILTDDGVFDLGV